MKSIILFYEHKAREYQLYEFLKEEMEKVSNKAFRIHILSYHWEKDRALEILNHDHVDAIFVPFAYEAEALKFYVRFYEKNHNIVIVNLHHEEITMPAMESVVLPKDDYSKNSIYHYVWTENFKEKLISSGTNRELIYVTGNGRNDIAKNISVSKEELAKEFDLNPQKKWLLYAENRKPDQLMAALTAFGIKEAQEITDMFIRSYNATMKEFDSLQDSFFDSFELIYRLHPGSNPVPIENKRIKQIKKYSFYDWLKAIDCVIVYSSTVAFEADMNNVPVIVHDPIDSNPSFFSEGVGFYYKIKTLQEIEPIVISNAFKHQQGKNNYIYYMGLSDGKCIPRIAKTTIDLIGKKSLCEPLNIKLPFMYYTKRKIRPKLFRIYKKSGLLNMIKKPYFVYNNQDDIPY